MRNIPNSNLISSNIIKEVGVHDLQVSKVLQKYKGEDSVEINNILNSQKEVSKISNKYKIHPEEVKIIINNLL